VAGPSAALRFAQDDRFVVVWARTNAAISPLCFAPVEMTRVLEMLPVEVGF